MVLWPPWTLIALSTTVVLVRGEMIAAVGESIRPTTTSVQVINATGKIVLPGFVNAHAHLQQYFRGVYEQVGDFYRVNLPLEGYRSPDDMKSMANASAAELLYGGCTTSFVIYTYPDGFAD